MAVIKIFDKANMTWQGPKLILQDCFVDIQHRRVLNAEETLDFVIPYSKMGSLGVDDWVEYKNRRFIVTTFQVSRSNGTRTVQVSCENAVLAILLNKIITPANPNADIPDTWLAGVDARTALQRITNGTPISVGTVDDFGTWDADFFDMNAQEALNYVRENWIGVNVVSGQYPGGGTTTPPDPGPDVTPASEVYNISADPGSSAITLNWVNPMESDFSQVYIYRGGNFVASLNSPTSTFTDTGLTQNTLYTYLFKTVDAAGNFSSGVSLNAKTTIAVDTTPPGNVVGLGYSALGNTSVTLGWARPGSATDFAKVKIYRDGTYIAETAENSYVATGLSANTAYTFRVTSVDFSGNESAGATYTVTTSASADTTPPPNTTAVNSSNTATSVTLTWTKPTSDPDLRFFNIYRNGVYVTQVSNTVTTYNDSGLSAGTTYVYKVTSIDGSGNESGGTVKSVTTTSTGDTTPPPNVTNLSETHNANSVTLFWTNPIVGDFAKVKIYRNSVFLTESTGTSYVNSSLTANTLYTYKVTSVDATGNESVGATINATTSNAFDNTAPANVTGINTIAAETSITVLWNANTDSDISKYRVYRNNMYIAEVPHTSSNLTYNDTGLKNLTSYTYKVTAVDTSGNESTGTTVTKSTLADTTAPGNPTNLNVTYEATTATISWNNPSSTDFAMAKVYRNNVLQQTFTGARLASYSWTNEGLTPQTTYTFKVTAVDNAGNESSGVSGTITTSALPPAADLTPPDEVLTLAETHTHNSVTLSWYNPSSSDFTKVRIYKDNVFLVEVLGTANQAKSYTATGLSILTSYTFRLTTVDSNSNESSGNLIVVTTGGDITPPANVSGVTFTTTQNSVTFNFTKPSDGDFVKTKIYRDFTGFPNYIGETAGTSFTESGLEINTSYTYRLKTVDTSNNESSGVVLTITTSQDTTAPGGVTNLRETHDAANVWLTWTNPMDVDFDHVTIYRNGVWYAQTSATAYTVAQLSNETLYKFDLYAVDRSGNQSPPTTLEVRTGAGVDTTPPANVTALAVTDTTPSSIKLTWTNPTTFDFAKIWVYRGDIFVAEIIGDNMYVNNGLASDTSYTFKVVSLDRVGNQSVGVLVTGKTKVAVLDSGTGSSDTTPPANITGLGFSRTATSVTLTWENPADSDFAKAQIFRNNVLVGETTSNVFTDSGLSQGSTLTYKVSSVDTSNNRSVGVTITITLSPQTMVVYNFNDITDLAAFKMWTNPYQAVGTPYDSDSWTKDTVRNSWAVVSDDKVPGVNAIYTTATGGEYTNPSYRKRMTWNEEFQFGGRITINYKYDNNTNRGFWLAYQKVTANSGNSPLTPNNAGVRPTDLTSYVQETYEVPAGTWQMEMGVQTDSGGYRSMAWVRKIIVEKY